MKKEQCTDSLRNSDSNHNEIEGQRKRNKKFKEVQDWSMTPDTDEAFRRA